jgi:hypothetical protein
MGAGLPLLGITENEVSGTPDIDENGDWVFYIDVSLLRLPVLSIEHYSPSQ